ncbi:hypothetical protein LSG31_12975 [Fodinisporobacter ferrooxydans]|uniref:DUF2642 domain-containing protein n=1 Tax=Fodinisporobacter ferrooxydans TaxID=2901836 RepID=A0ABY4CEM4_9BACL|nr:hypothetical protein LSG31_12975 [Alicyclobacillaceae bacterium MYW30-H2]
MTIRQKALRLIGKPVGITFKNGTGTSGVLCRVGTQRIFVIVFQIGNFFPLKHFRINRIHEIRKFPNCP